jgi:hypothetical protein
MKLFGRTYVCQKRGLIKMINEEIKRAVKNRYGKFAEVGGNKEHC